MKWKPLASELISMRGKTIFNAVFFSLSLHRQFCFLFMFYIWLECEFRLVCQRAKKKWSSGHYIVHTHSGAAAIAAVVAATTMTMTEMAKNHQQKKKYGQRK